MHITHIQNVCDGKIRRRSVLMHAIALQLNQLNHQFACVNYHITQFYTTSLI